MCLFLFRFLRKGAGERVPKQPYRAPWDPENKRKPSNKSGKLKTRAATASRSHRHRGSRYQQPEERPATQPPNNPNQSNEQNGQNYPSQQQNQSMDTINSNNSNNFHNREQSNNPTNPKNPNQAVQPWSGRSPVMSSPVPPALLPPDQSNHPTKSPNDASIEASSHPRTIPSTPLRPQSVESVTVSSRAHSGPASRRASEGPEQIHSSQQPLVQPQPGPQTNVRLDLESLNLSLDDETEMSTGRADFEHVDNILNHPPGPNQKHQALSDESAVPLTNHLKQFNNGKGNGAKDLGELSFFSVTEHRSTLGQWSDDASNQGRSLSPTRVITAKDYTDRHGRPLTIK